MKQRIHHIVVLTLLGLLAVPQLCAQDLREKIKNKRAEIESQINEPFDTTRDAGYWKRALRHGKFGIINDTSVHYPKFLEFCAKLYRWGDYTFNHYDTAYVKGTGKNWKLMVKNNNWLDTYAGHLGDKDEFHLRMNSNLSANFGAQISFMAVSLGYMFNINNWLNGDKVHNTRFDFSFTCSRLSLEAYYSKDQGDLVNLHRLGDYQSRSFKSYKFDGLKREYYGLYAYYFFNHLRYAQAAAYCYSKYQRRSAGSFIAGLHVSHQDVVIDFSKLSDEMLGYVPPEVQALDCRFRYRDHSFVLGYGYNWVFHRNWVYNVTALPSVGVRHSFPNSIDGKKDLFAFSFLGKMALVHNHRNFFYAFTVLSNGHWYKSKKYSFFNSVEDINVNVGFRF